MHIALAMARRTDRAASLLQQLEQADKEGDIYTSLTVIKTFCSRLANKGLHEKAAVMLATGATTVLRKGHVSCRDCCVVEAGMVSLEVSCRLNLDTS
jgi:hypothetical protein